MSENLEQRTNFSLTNDCSGDQDCKHDCFLDENVRARVEALETALRQLEKDNAAMRTLLGYHAPGCGVFQGGKVKIWPSREAYLSDEKCTCGLKALQAQSGTKEEK